MTEVLSCYCYHCRTYHRREDVRRVRTPTGYRWRCVRSIEASRLPRPERDAFGQAISAGNRAQAKALAVQRGALARFAIEVD